MASVREILERRPPDVLYHYTTQAGALGIIRSKEIWASHTQYLNDQKEFHHALSVVRAELTDLRLRCQGDTERGELIQEMQHAVEGIESINVCVCSFSEDGDVLSQWRAYGGGASGFSIGFAGEFLKSAARDAEFWLVPCLYEEELQRELIRKLIDDVLRENLERSSGGQEVADLEPGGNLVTYLNRYAPILKHRSFREEREWRIVSRPLGVNDARFEYRAGTSMLVPYYRICLDTPNRPFQIKEIIVGPTPHPEQSRSSLIGFLWKNEQEDTSVFLSEAPYRNW